MDKTAPSQAQVDKFVKFVDEMLSQGRAVLVHCGGGYSRILVDWETGTLVNWY